MSIPPLAYTDYGPAAVDKINAGFAAVDGVTNRVGTLEGQMSGALSDLQTLKAGDFSDRIAALEKYDLAGFESSTGTTLQGYGTRLTTLEGEMSRALDNLDTLNKGDFFNRVAALEKWRQSVTATIGDLQTAQSDQADALAAEAEAREAGDAAQASALAGAVSTMLLAEMAGGRPGEVPAAFTTDLASGIAGVPTNAVSAATSSGAVLRVPGVALIAPVGLRTIEVNRLYKARAVVTRNLDTPDLTGAAVVFGIAWYDTNRNRILGLPETQLVAVALTVAMGRQQWQALISSTPGAFTDGLNAPLPAVATPPAGAVFFRPYLRTEGATTATDLEVLESADVSDGNIINLSQDALAARLARCEAALGITSASA